MGTKRVEKKRTVQKPVQRINADGLAYTDYVTAVETYYENVYVPDSSPSSYDSGSSSSSYDSGSSYSGDSGGGSW